VGEAQTWAGGKGERAAGAVDEEGDVEREVGAGLWDKWPPPRVLFATVLWLISSALDFFYSAHHHPGGGGSNMGGGGNVSENATWAGASGRGGGGGDVHNIVTGLGGGEHGGGSGVMHGGALVEVVYVGSGLAAVVLCVPPILRCTHTHTHTHTHTRKYPRAQTFEKTLNFERSALSDIFFIFFLQRYSCKARGRRYPWDL
jgi:hypothetical protein